MSVACFKRAESVAFRRGDTAAILHGSRRISFTDLVAQALLWAAKLDTIPGEPVILCAPNSIDMAAAVLGVWAKGAIPALVHFNAPERHLAHAALVTGARHIVGGSDSSPATISVEPPPMGRNGKGPAPLQSPHVLPWSADEPASILFTSGSTGLPKGVVQSARNLIDGATRIPGHLGFRSDDRLLCPVPFAFDYGWGQLLSTLLNGTTLILPEPNNAFGSCDAIVRHRPTILAGVPAFFSDLLSGLVPTRQHDLSSIRLVTNTGSKIPQAVFGTLLDAFPTADISLNYGLTETWRSASLPPSFARSHPTSVGLAVPGVALAVLREDGSEAAPGETGEIIHRGAGVFLGYWAEPDRTAAVRRPDPLWCHTGVPAPPVVFTGDIGWKDKDGFLHIAGRRDRQIKSMGVRVSPDEVESLLLGSGLVREAAIVSRPHDTLGQMVVAIVAPDDPAHLDALKRHARSVMSPSMMPRDWLLLPTLPRLPSGKVDYGVLASLACA